MVSQLVQMLLLSKKVAESPLTSGGQSTQSPYLTQSTDPSGKKKTKLLSKSSIVTLLLKLKY